MGKIVNILCLSPIVTPNEKTSGRFALLLLSFLKLQFNVIGTNNALMARIDRLRFLCKENQVIENFALCLTGKWSRIKLHG